MNVTFLHHSSFLVEVDDKVLIFDYFDGNCSKEESIDKIKQYSRNYAKRQLTWFRNKEYVTEVLIDVNDFNNTVDEVYNLIIEFLKK